MLKYNNQENKIKYNDVITSLQDYMFNTINLNKYNNNNSNNNNSSNNKLLNTKTINYNQSELNNQDILNKQKIDLFLPKQTDTLFWCFFLMKYKDIEYETVKISNQFFLREKEEKFKYINVIRKEKDILKINKIKPLSEIEDDLANKQKIGLKTFIALCIIEKLNIIVINKRKIYESINNDSNNIYLINKLNDKEDKYYIDLEVTNEKIKNYRETYYKLESFDNSLKAISSYKLDELNEIAKKLGVNLILNNNKKKICKKDIYEQLVQEFN